MRARHLLVAVCVTSCLATACGDDDSKPGKGGAAGQAGAAGEAGKAGSGGSPTNGGTDSSPGGDGNPVGQAGGPGAAGNPGGLGGAGGEAPSGFVEFVHDLVENHTSETNQPAATNQQFTEPQDDHGHYLAPASAFDDLL